MKYWFVLLMVAMSLMGCASTKTETVTVVKNTYIEVPSELLERCIVTPPPEVTAYTASLQNAKEYMLAMYATNLLQDIAVCSQQINKIEQWSKQQSIIFQSNAKEVKDAKSR